MVWSRVACLIVHRVEPLHLESSIIGLLEGVLASKLIKLSWSVLLKEFIYRQVAASYSHVDLVVLNADVYSLCAELVNAFTLAVEHDPQSLSIGVVVDVFGQPHINRIALHWNIEGKLSLQVGTLLLEQLDFSLSLLKESNEFKRGFVRLIEFVF
jgi:hypothetical protein